MVDTQSRLVTLSRYLPTNIFRTHHPAGADVTRQPLPAQLLAIVTSPVAFRMAKAVVNCNNGTLRSENRGIWQIKFIPCELRQVIAQSSLSFRTHINSRLLVKILSENIALFLWACFRHVDEVLRDC